MAKIMFVEEMQSDWSQKRAAMPSPQNIERAADLQRTGETVGEAEAAADNLLDGFFGGTLPGAITQNTVQLFDNVKNSLKLMLDNDITLNQVLTKRQESIDKGLVSSQLPKIDQETFLDVLDDIEINDFYEFAQEKNRGILKMLTLQQRGMLDADELFDDISGDLIDAFANAYVEKAQDKIIVMCCFQKGKFARLLKEIVFTRKRKTASFC